MSVRRKGGEARGEPPRNKCSRTEPAGSLLSAAVRSSPHTSHPASDLRDDPPVCEDGAAFKELLRDKVLG